MPWRLIRRRPGGAGARGIRLAYLFGLLLAGALLASQLIAMHLLQGAEELVHPVSLAQASATLASAHGLARRQSLQPATVVDLPRPQAGGLSGAAMRVWIAAQAEVAPFAMKPQERRLAQDLRSMLSMDASEPLWLQLERISGRDARASLLSAAAWEPLRLRASIALPQGLWLNAELGLMGRHEWSGTLRYILPASILPVLCLGLLLSWWLMRPLRRLVAATGQVQHGREQPDLPLQGPREVRDLTCRFNEMQRRIARHRDSRTRLLASISHDLRTPVTELRLLAEMVDDAGVRGDLLASVADLQAMVEGTLDFARADLSLETTRDTDIRALLDQLVLRYGRLGQVVEVRHETPGPLHWPCRPLLLKRALSNLIDNALAHAGREALDAIEVRQRGGWLELKVLDRGPGIAAQDLERLLEPFEKSAGATQRNGHGLGLGLSIAEACIAMQGGTLVLSNRPEGGLCACLRLGPAQPSHDMR